MHTTTTILSGPWRFKEANPRGGYPTSDLTWMPATVPGHVHLDLMKQGVIGDPFYRMQERGCAWVDEIDWVYETEFEVADVHPGMSIRFGGLDTIAEIHLNSALVGCTDNMFIPHEFGVSDLLRQGTNTLAVLLRSGLRVGQERIDTWMEQGRDSLPKQDFARWSPRSFVRKAQYMYGWDWGPELVSCGIWQEVELIDAPIARLGDWHYSATLGSTARVDFSMSVLRVGGGSAAPLALRVEVSQRDAIVASASTAVLAGSSEVSQSIEIPEPVLWWPNGAAPRDELAGELYDVRFELTSDGHTIDSLDSRIGLRTIELVREPDADGKGESFLFHVNGEPIFAKGANWIPDDSFPARCLVEPGRTKVEDQIEMAARAGHNMLRIWGGGLYESEAFYSACDERGILVWQDFPYGCGYYPDTHEYAEFARIEAEAAVKRIRNHASLALWCGNNENQEMYHYCWEGKANKAPRLLGEKLYMEVLPEVVARLDPKTAYWPGSPYGGGDPCSEDFGDKHNWNVWHSKGVGDFPPGDWPNYLADRSRFVSEFGFAASCGLNAWDACLAPEDRHPESLAVRWHDKTRKGYDKYLDYIRLHFPSPQSLEDLVYYSQINQAEALRCGIENWRRLKGRCWGALYWQFNDCWPVQSWSAIDSDVDPKALYYASRRFYSPVLLSFAKAGSAIDAMVTNDLREPLQGDVRVTVETFDGQLLKEEVFEARIDGNGAATAGSVDVGTFQVHRRDLFIRGVFEPYWDIGQPPVSNTIFLCEPKDLRLMNAGLTSAVVEQEQNGQEGFSVRITAARFAAYLWWRLDGYSLGALGAYDQPNFEHLPAGETLDLWLPRTDGMTCVGDVQSRLRLRSL